MNVLLASFLTVLLWVNFPLTSFLQADSTFHFSLGETALTICFTGGNPSPCDPGIFEKGEKNTYLFSEAIDWQYDQSWILLLHPEENTRVEISDRYVNCMALRISETEGVIPFDHKAAGDVKGKLFYYGRWHTVTTNSFSHYGHQQSYWQPVQTGIDTSAFNAWYAQKLKEDPSLGSFGDRREVFCYQRQLRIQIYPAKGPKKTILLVFNHKDGTC